MSSCDPPVVDGHVDVDGHRLATRTVGSLTSGDVPLVLLHGGVDCISTWRYFPEQLAARTGHPVVAYDRWGHGASDRRDEPWPLGFQRIEAGPVLAQLLDVLSIDRAVLVGHSDGGVIALHAAVSHPDRVVGVAALVPQILRHPLLDAGIAQTREAFDTGGLAEVLRRHHGDNTETVFAHWVSRWQADDWTDASEGRFVEITCPVSVVIGRDDQYGWQPNAQLVATQLQVPYELLVVGGATHTPHRDRPDEVLGAIERLLRCL